MEGEGEWVFIAEVITPSVLYARNYHDVGGAIVGFVNSSDGGDNARSAFGRWNGVPWSVELPDTSKRYGGDRGNPVNLDFRWENGSWYLYIFYFAGNTNPKPEFRWRVKV